MPERILEDDCGNDEFQCDDGQCVNIDYLCDGHKYLGNAEKDPDCKDGSDEKFEVCCAGSY